jgi:hypothetical protein
MKAFPPRSSQLYVSKHAVRNYIEQGHLDSSTGYKNLAKTQHSCNPTPQTLSASTRHMRIHRTAIQAYILPFHRARKRLRAVLPNLHVLVFIPPTPLRPPNRSAYAPTTQAPRVCRSSRRLILLLAERQAQPALVACRRVGGHGRCAPETCW